MENIILIAVLLTLLGAGLVMLLVWLSVVSWKSIKFRKKAKTKFEDLNKNLEETTHSIYTSIEQNAIDSNNSINEIHNIRNQDLSMNDENLHELEQNTSKNLQDLRNYAVERFKELEHNIDSRFDKLYNQIKEK